MKYRNILILTLTILILAAGYFFYRDLTLDPQNTIVRYLEEESGYEIVYSKVNLWPLNQIKIEDLIINGDNFKLTAPKVRMGYSVFDYLVNSEKAAKIIKNVYLEKPELIYESKEQRQSEQLSFMEIKDIIFNQTDQLYVDIKDGKINLLFADNLYQVNSLNSAMKIDSGRKHIVVEVKKGFDLKGPLYDQFELEKITTDNFKISAELNNESWDLYFKNRELNISEFDVLITDFIKKEIPDYLINDIQGSASLDFHLTGWKEEILNYQSNIKIKDTQFNLKLKSASAQKNVKLQEVSLYLDSKQDKIFLENLDLYLDDVGYNFEAVYDLKDERYSGKLTSNDFKIDSNYLNNFLKKELAYSFSAEGELKADFDGDFSDINIISEINLDQLKVMEHRFKDVSAELRYLQNSVYLDQLNLKALSGASLELAGLYQITDGYYHMDIKAEGIQPGIYYDDKIIRDLISDNQYNFKQYLGGELDFNLRTTGSNRTKTYIAEAEFSFYPDQSNILSKNGVNQLNSHLLYTDKKIYIEDGKINFLKEELNLFGEIDLKEDSICVKLEGEGVELDPLNDHFELTLDGKNEIDISAVIEGELNNPLIKGEIASNRLSYQDYEVKELLLDFSYLEKKINVKDLSFNIEGEKITGMGSLDLADNLKLTDSTVDLSLKTTIINYDKLQKFINFDLPLTGGFQVNLQLAGIINDLKAEGHIISKNTQIEIDKKIYKLDQLKTDICWFLKENLFELKNGLIIKDNINLIVEGIYQENNIDLDFKANNFNIALLGLDNNTRGIFVIEGKVDGNISDPEIKMSFLSDDFNYNRLMADKFSGQITYNDDTIRFEDIEAKSDSSIYNITGMISNLSEGQNLNMAIHTDRGHLRDILNIVDYDISYDLEYAISGNLKLGGSIEDPEAEIRLSVFSNQVDLLDIEGEIGKKIDLKMTGRELPLSLFKLPDSIDYDIQYQGDLNFKVEMHGTRKDYEIRLETSLENLQVIGLKLSDIKGSFCYYTDGTLEINQALQQKEGQKIEVNGALNLLTKQISELNMDLEDYKLNHMDGVNSDVENLNGSLNGKVVLKGDIEKPDVDGQINIDISELLIKNIKSIEKFNGQLSFDEETINLRDFSGQYDEGSFELNGNINYTDRKNFWDIKLTGESFSLNRGSFNGKFNSEIRVINELKKPLIEGDLTIYDFIVDSDLNWPISNGNGQISYFEPQLKLNLIPREDVYFRDENIDIKVEGGSLELNYLENELIFIGELNSNQGSLDYYNNKFIVDIVNADFDRYSDNIPFIHLVGSTINSGVKIYIYVDGPADNLNIGFGSQPELPQERIIALLTRKGGLRGFTSEEGVEPGSIVQSELFRFVGEKLQLEFIQKLERNLQKIFELDRFEIDTYSLAGEREITIYLGKELTDDLYLQYIGTYSPEISSSEISFEYNINEYLNLEGGWYGEDDYRFLLEANIEF